MSMLQKPMKNIWRMHLHFWKGISPPGEDYFLKYKQLMNQKIYLDSKSVFFKIVVNNQLYTIDICTV